MVDVLIVTAPYTITDQPLAAPAILKSLLEGKYTNKFLDLNAELNLNSNADKIKEFLLQGNIADGWAKEFTQYIDDCAERINSFNPTWVAISIFTMFGQRFTDFIVRTLKHKYPKIKIILGGQGLAVNGINSNSNLGEDLLNQNLIDAYVKSEAENQLLEILDHNKPSSKEWQQVEDLNSLQYPCYDDYDFKNYKMPIIPITSSRGCVRKCTFCDIHQHWKKFVFRSGENIVDEIKHQTTKTKIKNFVFTDSLVNGSMKSYRDFVKQLASENVENNLGITWTSQFIIRPKNQMTEDDWKYTKLSGGNRLAVGVESLIERIRDEMGKKFSNDDIYYALEQARKYQIILSFLMIVGYVSETEDDHKTQMDIFADLSKYKDVIRISLGTTLGILPGTPLHANPEKYGIILGESENDWVNPSIGSTYEIRKQRRVELEKYINSLGFLPSNNLESLQHSMMDNWK